MSLSLRKAWERVITRELHCQLEATRVSPSPGMAQWGHGDDAEGRTLTRGKQCGPRSMPRSRTRCVVVGAAAWSRSRPSSVRLWWKEVVLIHRSAWICPAASPWGQPSLAGPFLWAVSSEPRQSNRQPSGLDRVFLNGEEGKLLFWLIWDIQGLK